MDVKYVSSILIQINSLYGNQYSIDNNKKPKHNLSLNDNKIHEYELCNISLYVYSKIIEWLHFYNSFVLW